jgi:Mg-chelatase subunit ChlD
MLKRGIKKTKKEKKEKESKGLSTIVATLLVIVLTIVAIGVIWVIIRNLIVNQSELVNTQKEFFTENVGINSIKVNNSLVSLSLKKTGGKMEVEKEGKTNQSTGVIEADIISVVDLSGSMAPSCNGVVSRTCCQNTLGGNYDSVTQICSGVNVIRNITCVTTCAGRWIDKLSAAKEANKKLIGILSQSAGSRIGIVAYSTSVNSSASLNLTSNVTQLNGKIDSWVSGGSTCICCGINEALNKLQQQSSSDRSKKIIVMSDGEANVRCATQNTPNATQDSVKASCDANRSLDNLIIYSIGVGEGVNEATLISISGCGGGKYFSAINISELVDVYNSVAEDIQTSAKSTSRFNYMYIIFYNGTTSYREKISEVPDVLAIKTYKFDMTGKLSGEIKKVEVYPVVLSTSGKEIIGPLFDSWESKF